jgi:hypothetical protein
MTNWDPDWDKPEATDQSGHADERSVVERLDDLGRRNPAYRRFGSMRYPLAFQSFTMKRPAVGSAIIGFAFFAVIFLLGTAADQGQHEPLVVTISALLAVFVFVGNWIGARHLNAQQLRGQRHRSAN